VPRTTYVDQRVLQPEIVDPRLADVETLARWMDDAVPLPGPFAIGLDALLGLIPGIGDAIGALISLYIVWRGVQMGVPRVTIMRMMTNIGIDTLVGSIPVVGDTFDFAWKSNKMNVELLRAHLSDTRRQKKRDWLFILLMVVLLIAVIVLPVIAVIKLINRPLL
jgi:hypothetical protein